MADPASIDERVSSLSDEELDVMKRVVEILRKIQFGTVVIVVQTERSSRSRWQRDSGSARALIDLHSERTEGRVPRIG
jgi:hypothetical protein